MCQGSNATRKTLPADILRAERQNLRRILRERGYAITAPRTATYDIMLESNDHICAEHILEAIARLHPTWRVNKTTVYRTLDLFKALGLVHEMKRSDGRAQYELASHGLHGHLVCRLCGELQDLDPDIATTFQQELRDRAGFEADLASYAVLGLCCHCAPASH